MDYGKVLSRAWEITWRWKVLWILGFLASLGNVSGTSSNVSYSTDSGDWGYRYHGPQIPAEVWAILAGAVCLGLIIGIIIWVVSVIARGSLIAGVQQVEDEGATGFRQAWRVGVSRFWTLFGISILAAIPIIILVLSGIAALVAFILGAVSLDLESPAAPILGGLFCGGTFCCGLVILAVILDQIRVYAERAAILEGLGWIESFKRGWDVLKENLGPTIVLWLIFLIVGLVLAAAIFMVLLAIFVPFIAVVANIDPGPWLVAPICCGGLIAIIFGALVSAIIETFTSATWTLAYRELTGIAEAPAVEPVAEP
jgi:hypothetical protein